MADMFKTIQLYGTKNPDTNKISHNHKIDIKVITSNPMDYYQIQWKIKRTNANIPVVFQMENYYKVASPVYTLRAGNFQPDTNYIIIVNIIA